MNNIQKRFLLFIFVCCFIRLLFVIISKYINPKYLPILGYLALIPGLGFIIIYFTKIRVKGKGGFNNDIWWDKLRPIHGILYLLFAYNAINKNKNSWKYLLIDVIIGLIAFLNYHYQNNNFRLLL